MTVEAVRKFVGDTITRDIPESWLPIVTDSIISIEPKN